MSKNEAILNILLDMEVNLAEFIERPLDYILNYEILKLLHEHLVAIQ